MEDISKNINTVINNILNYHQSHNSINKENVELLKVLLDYKKHENELKHENDLSSD